MTFLMQSSPWQDGPGTNQISEAAVCDWAHDLMIEEATSSDMQRPDYENARAYLIDRGEAQFSDDVECPSCDGIGLVGYEDEMDNSPCPLCSGTGRVASAP